MSIHQHINRYSEKLIDALKKFPAKEVSELYNAIQDCWNKGRTVYLCGNGGSTANALHIANDLLLSAARTNRIGLGVEALSANQAVITTIANDMSYDAIFSEQIKVKGAAGDLLIALSGSGNSPNVVKAIESANAKGMVTFAILGYTGGKCKALAQHPIHFEIHDMQVVEDLQLTIGHMCMQWICAQSPKGNP